MHGFLADAEKDSAQDLPIAKVNGHKFVWGVLALPKGRAEQADRSRQDWTGTGRSRQEEQAGAGRISMFGRKVAPNASR